MNYVPTMDEYWCAEMYKGYKAVLNNPISPTGGLSGALRKADMTALGDIHITE